MLIKQNIKIPNNLTEISSPILQLNIDENNPACIHSHVSDIPMCPMS